MPSSQRRPWKHVPPTVREYFGVREYSGEIVRLSCAKCGRAGQYRKQNLIKRYGADIRLPDLREEIAQCERRGQTHDACMVRYVDLVP